MTKALRCRTHGRVPWLGDIACDACGRVYLDVKKGDAPADCPCGARLAPRPGEPDGGAFSARAVCRRCAQKRLAARPS